MLGQRSMYKWERQRHEAFVGRAALLAQLDDLLVDTKGDRWVVVTGGPGMGKSAILAEWLRRREAAGHAVPHHFIRRGLSGMDNPIQAMGSLVVRDPAERERPFMTNPDLPEGTEFPATVVFVVIQGLKDCSDAPQIPGALRALNEALRDVDAGSFVLSTITGVIVVVPDTVAWNADDTFHALDQATVGFPLRVGVTHGTVEVVRDIDDERNLIGPPINIAARLATSPQNPGLLAHESYAAFVDAMLSASHWLHRSVRQAMSIAGNPQEPTFVCFPSPHTFAAKGPAPHAPSSPRPAVLVAYDLPKFSAGDRAQLRQRFTRLVHVFQKLRQSASLQAATVLLLPGGDGGVLVLEGVNLPDAAAIAARLRSLTEIESLDHAEALAIETRIGVHYGPVEHYVNARGIRRPTGLAVFAADDIAGDAHARSRRGIIFTRLLADSLVAGSSQRLASEFEALPPLTSGPAAQLERFVQVNRATAATKATTDDPKVDRALFDNEIRVFHTVSEVRESFAKEEPFLPRAVENAFVGRDDELRTIDEFLNGTKPFLLVHGSGGIGKTRLLLEAGERTESKGEWQVLWANVASLSMSGSWFEAIVPERKTLLLVDEPDDPKLLQVLAEQLGPRVGRLAQWKVLVAVRSPKDPVLRYFHGPRRSSQVQELPLGDLEVTASVKMCRGLLLGKVPTEVLDNAANAIAKRFSGHPVWITLAVHLIESFGNWQNLPTTSQELARQYIKEIIEKQDEFSHQDIERVLRWLALAGNVNREDLGTMDLLAERAGVEDGVKLGAIVNRLIERRALIERGAHKRIVEVKPDVIRDRVLIDWLTAEVGGATNPRLPTKAAKELAKAAIDAFISGRFVFTDRITLTALARSELVLRFDKQQVDLLAPFWQDLKDVLPKLSAQKRVDLVDVLLQIAPFRPRDTTDCVRFLRTDHVETERVDAIFGLKNVGYRDVILALPWLEFHAALAASEEDCLVVIQELCSLVIAENEATGGILPNDGKRAGQLLHRVVEGGPQFVSSFDSAARVSALAILEQMAAATPRSGESVLIDALLIPLVSVERSQSWSAANAFHWRRYVISPDEEAFAIRTEILQRVRALLENAHTPLQSRVLLWKVIVESHRSTNISRDEGARIEAELLDDLRWAWTALQRATLEELRVARDLWDWHLEFDQQHAQRKEAAEALEALYRANNVAGEFEELLRWDEPSLMGERHAKKAQELALQDVAALNEFLARGLVFLGGPDEIRRLLGVAFQLGRLAHDKPVAAEFVKAALHGLDDKPRTEFAIEILAGWIFDVRNKGGVDPVGLITGWCDWCISDIQRASLLERFYAWYGPVSEKDAEEQQFLRASDALFMRAGRGSAYIACVSHTFWFEWDRYTECMGRALDAMPPDQMTRAIAFLIEGVDRGLRSDKSAQPPLDLGRWILDQVLRLSDLDSIGGNTEWHLNQIIERVGPLPTRWLLDALRLRAKMEQEEPVGSHRGVGHSVQLTKYVMPLSQADKGSEQAAAIIEALLDYVLDHGSIGYKLPAILGNVDPEGIYAPDAIVRRLGHTVGYDQLSQIARLGEAYTVGTAPWKIIARAMVRASTHVGERERRSLFRALGDPGPRGWSGTPGEVPSAFTSALDAARARRDAETDDALRPYWDWYVSAAQAGLDDAVERAKEERGE